MKKNGWLALSLACLTVSVLSLFTTVVAYTDIHGIVTTYNVIDLLGYKDFAEQVMFHYTGTLFLSVQDSMVIVITAIGVAAILLALVGVVTMSLQRRNRWPFVLALLGIVGTAIPSLTILGATLLSRDYFNGTISGGIYPIVTPIAMVVCLITVTRKRKRTLEELLAAERAEGLIRRAGDL